VEQRLKDVFFQRYGPQGQPRLPGPVNVSRNPRTFSWLPRVAVTDDDPAAVFVLWQEIIFSGGSHGGDVLFARSSDGGSSFAQPLNLSDDVAGSGKGRLTPDRWHNGSLDLALGDGGALYTAWTDYEGSLWFRRSTDGGRSFSAPLLIVAPGDPAAPARGPAFALHGERTIYLAWSVGEQPAADIHVVRSTDGGATFTDAQVALRTPGLSDAPKLVAAPAGELHLVFTERSATQGADYHVAYSRLDEPVGYFTEPGGAFTEPVNLSHPLSAGGRAASFPSIAAGPDGHLYVLWELFTEDNPQPTGLGYTLSTDHGRSWTEPAVVPGSLDPGEGINGSLQGRLMQKLAANDSARITVVNSIFRPDDRSFVRLVLGEVISDAATDPASLPAGEGPDP
jgi:hypothetical protein